MYEYDRPSALLISLLDTFIRQTERSLAFFFTVFVFIVVALLTVFGKAAFYPTIVGLTGVFLLEARGMAEGIAEMRKGFPDWRYTDPPPAFLPEGGIAVAARDYGKRFAGRDLAGIFETLRRFLRLVETAREIWSDKACRRDARRSVLRTVLCAKKALIDALVGKYGLADDARKQIERACRPAAAVDPALIEALLRADGIDAASAKCAGKIIGLLGKTARLAVRF